jgi:hypothetical protein
MKAEGEFGYESDLLLEMILDRDDEGRKTINRCFILKDRSDTMNGKMIDFPKFADFKPIIQTLNLGGEHFGVDTTRDSQEVFGSPDFSRYEAQKQRDIALEELDAELVKSGLDGRSDAAKKARIAALETIFGTSSATAIKQMSAENIRRGIGRLKESTGPKDPTPTNGEEKAEVF